jgi:geranylgeranyl reductase family protein
MNMNYFDVTIIGTGPAGATAAFKLAEKGISVALIEKETLPRYKTCGGGLVFRGKKMLPFNIDQAIDSEFKTIDIYFSGQNLHLQSTRDFPIVSMVMRDKFDSLIVEEARKKGVTLFENNKLVDLKIEENISIVTSQTEIKTKFVIAADGALSSTAKLAGWKEDTRYLIPALEYEVELKPEVFERLKHEARFDIDFIPQGYAWSYPKKNHLSLGVGSFLRTRMNLKKYYSDYVEFLGITKEDIVHESAHGFQIPVSRRKDDFVKNNVFLIGDAAGFADPITAEGISNSIYSGILAAEAIAEAELDSKLAEKKYIDKIHEKLIPELKTAEFLAKIFYKKVKIRNFMIKQSGNKFCEYMTDIFVGERYYPKDLKKTVRKKIKEIIFK